MNYKNFAYSNVDTAPVPATSGTSLVVSAGTGSRFPTVPFYATVWQAGVQPSAANAEIVLVTLVSTDTFTITRQQEGTSARTIVAGDQIAATITAATVETFKNLNTRTVTDTDTLTASDDSIVCNNTTAMAINLPAATGNGKVFYISSINAGEVTVTPNGADTIDGETSQIIGQWDTLTIFSYAVNKWKII